MEVVKCFDSFEKQFSESELDQNEFSVASQHYDFMAPIITKFAEISAEHKLLRLFETTTIQILDEVAQGNSEIGGTSTETVKPSFCASKSFAARKLFMVGTSKLISRSMSYRECLNGFFE